MRERPGQWRRRAAPVHAFACVLVCACVITRSEREHGNGAQGGGWGRARCGQGPPLVLEVGPGPLPHGALLARILARVHRRVALRRAEPARRPRLPPPLALLRRARARVGAELARLRAVRALRAQPLFANLAGLRQRQGGPACQPPTDPKPATRARIEPRSGGHLGSTPRTGR